MTTSVESADIVIMSNRLSSVIDAHQIGVSSYRKTQQNLALAFSFNGIGVTAAITGLVSPVWAMIAMTSSVTAVLANSFGGQLLRGETPNTGYQSLTSDSHHQAPNQPNPREDDGTFTSDETDLLDIKIDGYTVRYWAGLAAVITAATLLVGAWLT